MLSFATFVTVDRRRETIEHPRRVRARIVHAVRRGLRSRAPGGEAPVAERAERLAQALRRGVVPLVPEQPPVHRGRPLLGPTTTSARSDTTMSAPASRREPGCPVRSTPITSRKPPRRPASTPAIASSTTAVRVGVAPRRRRRLDEDRRVRLAGQPERRRGGPVHQDREEPGQPRGVQHGFGVPAGGDHRDSHTGCRARLRTSRTVESYGSHALGGDPLQEVGVLAPTQPHHRVAVRRVVLPSPRQPYAARRQERVDAVLSPSAVDVGPVIVVGELDERLPARSARLRSQSSNICFQAARCTRAVSVTTPSISKTTASRSSGCRTTDPWAERDAVSRRPAVGVDICHHIAPVAARAAANDWSFDPDVSSTTADAHGSK